MIPVLSVPNLMHLEIFFVQYARLLLALDADILETSRFPGTPLHFKSGVWRPEFGVGLVLLLLLRHPFGLLSSDYMECDGRFKFFEGPFL